MTESGSESTRNHRNTRTCWFIGAVVVTCVMYLRGEYLLGRFAGVMFATISLAIVVIGYRNLCLRKPSRVGITLYAIFAAICVTILLMPVRFSPSLQHFVDKQATDRNARAELYDLFDRNDDYSNLVVSTTHVKLVCVSLSASVPDRDAADALLAELARTELVHHCSLSGYVRIRDEGKTVKFNDDDLKPAVDD